MNVGVLGGGQLGRMLALAGVPLGHHFTFVDPNPRAPARVAGDHVCADWSSDEAADRLAACDVVTYEFENVPDDVVASLAERVPVRPNPGALSVARDRADEKSCLRNLGIPTADFAVVHDEASLTDAVATVGLPAVLKTRREGYDGKGQVVIRDEADALPAHAKLGGAPAILERFVTFERELSVVAARGSDGEMAFYPLTENHHDAGILSFSIAPAPGATPALQRSAEDLVRNLAEHLDYVGVLALELFEVDGELWANEMAPRVHNSGHWTIEGAQTSQFENHLRAITRAPLGSTEIVGPSAMLNLIGELPEPTAILRIDDAHLHLYGKAPRPGRKLGHVTVRATSTELLTARLAALRAAVT